MGTTGPVSQVYLTGTVGAATGDVVLAAGPTYFADKRVGFAGQTLASGFAVSPTRPLSQAAVDLGLAGQTSIQPIGVYTSAYPGVIDVDPADLSNPVVDGVSSQSHRVIGLRATLTVNGNVLNSIGMVYASDNGSYYPDTPAYNYDQNPVTGGVSNRFIFEDEDIYDVGLGNGSVTNRSVVAGPFSYAAMYEASYMPTNDNILSYKNRFPTCVRATLSANETTTASMLMDGPYVLFHLIGVSSGTSVTLTVQTAYELPIRLGPASGIGFLIAEARLCRKYFVDWDMLSPIPVGGHLLVAGLAAATQPWGKTALSMALGKSPCPVYNRPANVGLTVPSSTQMMVNVGLDGRAGESLQTRISDAASNTRTPAQVYRDGTQKLQAKHGKSKGEIAAGAVEGAVGVASGLYNAKLLMDEGRKQVTNKRSAFNRLKQFGGGLAREALAIERAAGRALLTAAPIIEEVAPLALMAVRKKRRN